ncbi:peptidase, M20 family protein [Desulfosarcina variabilis str. Montpellier]|uniref:M20 family metallopeptidase n=1 Tax=Desulfosarcina variabilis TaxID=2300 RepID=UPI003AFA3F9F
MKLDCGHNRGPNKRIDAVDEIVPLTQSLIRFKTMHSRMDEIAACTAFIENYLVRHAIEFVRSEHDGYPSILVLPDNAQPVCKVLMMAHIDVVDAPDALFEPVIRDNRLFGRGAVDDKYAVALSLVLLKKQVRRLRKLGKTQQDLGFGILITSDEEIGGYHGVGKAVEKIHPEFCVALDGGTPEKIIVKEKGLLTVKLTTIGKAAHGSRPWLGDNAVDHLIADYSALKTLFEPPGAGSWSKTMNLGIVNAGKSFNQVPDRAEAIFDIRYTENENPDQLFDQMQAMVDGELSVIRKEPMFLGGTSTYLEQLCELAPDARIGFEHGASDARFFSEKGINGIIWGADGDNSAHAADEHVNIDSILKIYRVLTRFVEGLAPV